MSEKTGISWCDHTFNPWIGCRHVSAGCAHCYMFTEQRRYGSDPSVVRRTKTWGDPAKWNAKAAAAGVRRRVFTCSWSDFFVKEADAWRLEACRLMEWQRALDFQILTKRPERFDVNFFAAPNFWLGVSVENKKQGLPRMDILRDTPAALRFVSFEPLLEDLGEVDLAGIHWIIIGGESGPGARPMRLVWAESLIEQGRAARCRVFFKQTGAVLARKRRMRDVKGANPREWPASLCVQESPGGHPYSMPQQPRQLSLL